MDPVIFPLFSRLDTDPFTFLPLPVLLIMAIRQYGHKPANSPLTAMM